MYPAEEAYPEGETRLVVVVFLAACRALVACLVEAACPVGSPDEALVAYPVEVACLAGETYPVGSPVAALVASHLVLALRRAVREMLTGVPYWFVARHRAWGSGR